MTLNIGASTYKCLLQVSPERYRLLVEMCIKKAESFDPAFALLKLYVDLLFKFASGLGRTD